MTPRTTVVLRMTAAAFVAGGTGLRAQDRTSRAVIDGVVTDSALVAVGGAVISILGSRLEVRTGENGRFRIIALPAGQHMLLVRRLGYAPFSATVTLSPSDTLRTTVMLKPTPALLDTVVVRQADWPAPSIAEFEARRTHGAGQYMTASEIRRLNMTTLSDVLATFHSVAIGSAAVFNTRGFGARPCPYRIFVDGSPLSIRQLEADLPSPNEIAGIEVYTSSATVPLQYATFGGDVLAGAHAGGAVCGVILLWTKRS